MPADPVPQRTIILIGLRASGKTAVGGALAGRLGRTLVDLDDRTAALLGEARAGEALSRHGLSRFRAAETTALASVLEQDGLILALGGGTPTAPGADELLRRARLSGRAIIVYLHADAATLRSRLQADPTHRPSLTGRPAAEEVEILLAERDRPYQDLADLVVDATSGSPENVAEAVARALHA